MTERRGTDQQTRDPAMTRIADQAAEPDTVAEIDPDVAALLGLRPPDAPPIPTVDEIGTAGEITDTRIYEGDLEVAAGFGTTAEDEPFDPDHHSTPLPAVDEVEARVLEALRADAATTGFADALELDAEGGRVVVRGAVDDVDDEDAVLAVVESVTGVSEAVGRLEVRSLGDTERASQWETEGGS